MLVTNTTSSDIYFGPLHLGAGNGTQLTVDDTSATSLYLLDDSVADALNNAWAAGRITVTDEAQPFPRPTGDPQLLHGSGDPEGLVYAPQGSVYMRRDGVQSNGGVLYMKTTGVTDSDGWLDLATASGATAVLPPGVVMPYGGSAVPSGWLRCDGSAISRSLYSLLFSAIGTAYGAGDGSTTFNIPDLQGRLPVGLGTHADVSSLGNSDNLTTVADRRPAHKHTVGNPAIGIDDPGHAHGITDPEHSHGVYDPGHSHTYNAMGSNHIIGGGGAVAVPDSPASTSSNTTGISLYSAATGISIQSHGTGITASATGGTVGPQTGAEPADNPAYLVVNYIIKT